MVFEGKTFANADGSPYSPCQQTVEVQIQGAMLSLRVRSLYIEEWSSQCLLLGPVCGVLELYCVIIMRGISHWRVTHLLCGSTLELG